MVLHEGMAQSSLTVCSGPGCWCAVARGERYCPTCQVREGVRDREQRGGAVERGYDWRWRAYRARYLREHPLCVQCTEEGRVEAATVVDHIVPHKGDKEVFWSVSNHRALCKAHHDARVDEGDFGR